MAINQSPQPGSSTNLEGSTYLDGLVDRAIATGLGPGIILTPQNAKGIAGFLFDYEGDTSVTLQAEITDHFAEDNSFVNDHIAIKPDRLVLRGFVAELVNLPPQGILGLLSIVQTKLGVVPAYLGKYTPQALNKVNAALTQAQSTVNTINQGIARVKNIVGLFRGSTPTLTQQQDAYAKLESLFKSRQVFTVNTPYKIFDDMVIESLVFTQPEDTKYLSDIVVTLKQMRFVDVSAVPNLLISHAGRAFLQAQPQQDQGKTPGNLFDESILHKSAAGIKSFFQ